MTYLLSIIWTLPAILIMLSIFLLPQEGEGKLLKVLRLSALFSVGGFVMVRAPELSTVLPLFKKISPVIPKKFLGFPTLFTKDFITDEIILFTISLISLYLFMKFHRDWQNIFGVLTGFIIFLISAASFANAYSNTKLRDETTFRDYKQIGDYIKTNFPQKTVLIVEAGDWYESLPLMFYSERNAYPTSSIPLQEGKKQASAKGYKTLFITQKNMIGR